MFTSTATAIPGLPATDDGSLIRETEQLVPGSVHYNIRRFVRPEGWAREDTGALHYEMNPKGSTEKGSLQLFFCLTGNTYCTRKGKDCDRCALHPEGPCPERTESLDLLQFSFTPSFLAQFARTEGHHITESVLSFRHSSTFTRTVPLCNKTRAVLEALLNHNYSGSLANIFVNAQVQLLLLQSLNCLLGEKEPEVFECRFLANTDDREKILRARDVLLEHIGEPITIKELSRKVAINECYLKKGFKELFGTTIFEFYQGQRMEHAKYLLYEKGLSVTEVSVLLGYSSISHFSTAFKKHTGLKPCELLLR
ncbi:AraC family transcriptional regulator [Flaviaesturariibacter flavus]|uniref:AraC family transcriptional regulator n=1 Tax=Flaviaesturariibacter flavus TaxID=2502780 RepID=A0A4R1BLI3_9BACT|nr:AraC family transcriptional regulator [Flaviaesturariibacter flavus]TCJ18234.1 AraC family transcriptional regulator [Flaviaesturariibacter flavus]